jgi:hypothetical protein|tara:strand:+ start:288 stop:863 length:576 start_codon:yes stop_codon:yes gene_type:complete
MTEKRRLEFISNDRYKQLDKDVVEKIKSYRRLNSRIVRKESLVDNLQKKIRTEKGKLVEMRNDLTKENHFIDDLRSQYEFSCSIVELPPRGKNSIVYYNLCINRKGIRKSKDVGLGRRKTIKRQLLEHLKNNPTERDFVERDWFNWLFGDCNKKGKLNRKGSSYERIEEMIFNNPYGFKNEKITRDTLFPI